LVIDGPVDGPLFPAYVEQHLAATLCAGDVVVIDNLSSHKVAGVRKAIEAVGARLVYLPPYSPDFNPIEQLFAKLKWLVRSAQERTVTGLASLLGRLVDRFLPHECGNYFRNSRYFTE
jgi:transposase